MNALRSLSVLVTSAFVVACVQDNEETTVEGVDVPGSEDIAIVDGQNIPESVLEAYALDTFQSDAENLTAEGRAEIIERLVAMKVLANEAERMGLHRHAQIAGELQLQRMRLLANSLTDRFTEENPPTEAELRDLYELNLSQISGPEYKVRHILVDTEAEAVSLIEQLDEGADFAELAREHSTDTATAPEGGDLGWSSVDAWITPFADAVRAATPGVLLDEPVETRYGWHVILVEDSAEQVAPGLEAVRQDLIVEAETRKLDDYTTGLREAAEVTVID